MSKPDDTETPAPRKLIDGAFIFLLLLALSSGGLAVWLKGFGALGEAWERLLADMVTILPQMVLGVTVGAFFTMLVPRSVISRLLGRQAGLRGIIFASFFGTVMPAGPFASFPIVYALARSGAGVGALIAFLTAWAAVGLNRLVIWELPFMGVEFSALRFISSLPLPIIAGILADRLTDRVKALKLTWD